MLNNNINWTKNDMARVIVQALFNTDALPSADNIHVKRISAHSSAHLFGRLQRAYTVLERQPIIKD